MEDYDDILERNTLRFAEERGNPDWDDEDTSIDSYYFFLKLNCEDY